VYWNLQQLPTDETVLAWNDQSAGVQDLNTQRWSASNGSTTAMYARIMLQVTLASEFLRQTAEERLAARGVAPALRTEVQTYRAEARFLRALSYWHAIDLFGGVPLVTEETPVGAAAPAQATRQQLFDFVRTELEAVRAALPVAAPGGSAGNPNTYGRATQQAADMLLAKLYLNAAVYTGTARWAEAQAATQRVIASGAYALEPVYQRLFLADNNLSPELIFVVTQDGSRTQTFGGTTYLAHAPLGNRLNDRALQDFGVNGGWFGLRTRPEFVGLFPPALANDARGRILFGDGQTLTSPASRSSGRATWCPSTATSRAPGRAARTRRSPTSTSPCSASPTRTSCTPRPRCAATAAPPTAPPRWATSTRCARAPGARRSPTRSSPPTSCSTSAAASCSGRRTAAPT
jgi:hypothetical protein